MWSSFLFGCKVWYCAYFCIFFDKSQQNKNKKRDICDPFWEKVQFGANIDFILNIFFCIFGRVLFITNICSIQRFWLAIYPHFIILKNPLFMVNIFDRFTFIMVIFYVSISCYYVASFKHKNVNSIIYHMKEKQREKNSTVAGAVFLPNMRHKVENEENTRFYFSVFNVFNVIICSQREFEAHFMYRFSSHPNFSMPFHSRN